MTKYELVVEQAGLAAIEMEELKLCLELVIRALFRFSFALVTGIQWKLPDAVDEEEYEEE